MDVMERPHEVESPSDLTKESSTVSANQSDFGVAG